MSDKKVIAEDEISIFCEQIAMVLKSGVPLYEGLEAVCENYKDTKYEEYFLEINAEYGRGRECNPAGNRRVKINLECVRPEQISFLLWLF